jgi:hypothetical protein
VQSIVAHLPNAAAVSIKGGLNLILLDRYMDGVPAEKAARRIRRSADLALIELAVPMLPQDYYRPEYHCLLKPTGRLMAITEAKPLACPGTLRERHRPTSSESNRKALENRKKASYHQWRQGF